MLQLVIVWGNTGNYACNKWTSQVNNLQMQLEALLQDLLQMNLQ